jgi:hypothetical protein
LVLSAAKPNRTGVSGTPRLRLAAMGRLVLSVAKPNRTGVSGTPRLRLAAMGRLVLSVAKPNRTGLHRRVSSAGCGAPQAMRGSSRGCWASPCSAQPTVSIGCMADRSGFSRWSIHGRFEQPAIAPGGHKRAAPGTDRSLQPKGACELQAIHEARSAQTIPVTRTPARAPVTLT